MWRSTRHPRVERAAFSEREIACAKDNLGFESYSELDELGRCGVAEACLGPETIPAYGEERERHQRDPSDRVAFHPLRLRGGRIALQPQPPDRLGARRPRTPNECNLVTGTRYMNADVMRPYEEQVADYIYDTGNHVFYRATPEFLGDELVCRGIEVEAYSLEDDGAGIDFRVWCPNVQPGVEIDYATGDARLAEDAPVGEGDAAVIEREGDYVPEHELTQGARPCVPGVLPISRRATARTFMGRLPMPSGWGIASAASASPECHGAPRRTAASLVRRHLA